MTDKVTLDTVAGGFNLSGINANFQKIEDELNNKVLYRNPPNGTPNTMEKDLDLNGKRVYNVGAPVGQNDLVRVRDLPNLTGEFLPDVPTTATDISFIPYGTLSSTNVQNAIQELLDEIPEIPTPTTQTAADTPFTPFGTVAATNVQAAMEELITEGTGGSAPAASETVAGVAELATASEVATGTDTTRIVTPARLKTQLDLKQNLITFQEEGSSLGSGVSTINFTGTGATASKVGSTLTVNVPGGSGGAADTSELDHVQTGTGGATLTLEDILNQDQISVKRFGAVGDGVTNDYAAIQETIDYCLPRGLKVYFPAGTYICNSGLTVNFSSATDDYSYKCTLVGDGPNASRIGKTSGGHDLITITGGSGAGVHGYLAIDGLYLQGHDLTGIGIAINKIAFMSLRDVVILGFNYGFYATNFLSSNLERVYSRFNNYGGRMERLAGGSYESDPNAVTFTACVIANNYNYGMWVVAGACINMFGGSVEGNGIGGADATKFGVLISNPGVEGSVGGNFNGVYFENNKGTADVWLTNSARSIAHNFSGCSFNRISGTNFTTNNIRVETSGGQTQTVAVMGCGFKRYNDYSASASRKYIEGVGSTNQVSWAGCYFQDSSEVPSITNFVAGTSSGVTSFNTRSGAVTLNSGDVTSALGYTPQVSGSYEPANSQIVKFTDGNGIGSFTVTPVLSGCPVNAGNSKWIRCQNSAGADVWMLGWFV